MKICTEIDVLHRNSYLIVRIFLYEGDGIFAEMVLVARIKENGKGLECLLLGGYK